MTFKDNQESFVWIFLPGEVHPMAAGKLEEEGGFIHFNYGKSYRERIGGITPAMPIYEPQLPLPPGVLPLPDDLRLPNYRNAISCARRHSRCTG